MTIILRFYLITLSSSIALGACSKTDFNGAQGASEQSLSVPTTAPLTPPTSPTTPPIGLIPGGPIGPGTVACPIEQFPALNPATYHGVLQFACLSTVEIIVASNGKKLMHMIGIGGSSIGGNGLLNSIEVTWDLSVLSTDDDQWLLHAAHTLSSIHSLTPPPLIRVSEYIDFIDPGSGFLVDQIEAILIKRPGTNTPNDYYTLSVPEGPDNTVNGVRTFVLTSPPW